ncbi:MAG: hypothetical protein ACXVXE_10015 [Nocardioidaceae bacterium]
MPELLLGLFVVVLVVGLAVHLLTRNTAALSLGQRERAELADLRALVDDLKETAWVHRELDSALSTIIIDMIRSYERRDRGDRDDR